ncbi:MAG: hypothetical protein HC895_18430 [Leptolyngbyaceae cyanobacterium SM1_3_5]|nr:hypothetical protein [Leptolyngbyaceae cyanobacterium SM1_3_5]
MQRSVTALLLVACASQCSKHCHDAIEQAALAAGAYGLVISGAGPTLLALAADDRASDVATAMREAWQAIGVDPQVQILAIDPQGARISTR